MYITCWHIFRMKMGDDQISQVKMAGRDCPCTHDPEKNPRCKYYEPVKIDLSGCSSEVERPASSSEVADNRKLPSAPKGES